MTVKDLIKLLRQYDKNRIVILQKDVEGNGHSPLGDMWEGAYLPETTWYGRAGLEELTQEDIDAGYSEDDVITGGQPALFLVPVN